MDRTYIHFVNATQSERIVRELQTAQHLYPHSTILAAIERAKQETGFCPEAARKALETLQLDRTRQIGRLRRCELVQLGRAIHRYWLQKLGVTTPSPT